MMTNLTLQDLDEAIYYLDKSPGLPLIFKLCYDDYRNLLSFLERDNRYDAPFNIFRYKGITIIPSIEVECGDIVVMKDISEVQVDNDDNK